MKQTWSIPPRAQLQIKNMHYELDYLLWLNRQKLGHLAEAAEADEEAADSERSQQ
jgi:hypothetical protein